MESETKDFLSTSISSLLPNRVNFSEEERSKFISLIDHLNDEEKKLLRTRCGKKTTKNQKDRIWDQLHKDFLAAFPNRIFIKRRNLYDMYYNWLKRSKKQPDQKLSKVKRQKKQSQQISRMSNLENMVLIKYEASPSGSNDSHISHNENEMFSQVSEILNRNQSNQEMSMNLNGDNPNSSTINPLSHYIHSSQSHSITRHWQSQGRSTFSPKDFVLPVFIIPDNEGVEQIDLFPGVNRMGVKALIKYLKPLVERFQLSSILLFPCMKTLNSEKKIENAFDAKQNSLIDAIPKIKSQFPKLLILTDVCLCAFTDHGHCCVFDSDTCRIDNSLSVQSLVDLALQYARLGADVIAPSDMMDSRIASMRNALNTNGFSHVAIMTYGAKFESCFYGPFRNAAGSAPKFGDRKSYQLPAGSRGMALRSVDRDVNEGADMIMVKPAMAYLDIVRSIADQHPNFPIAVYQVSAEYSMIVEAAGKGIFDLKRVVIETLTCFKRAGATIIFTYFTPQILEWIESGQM